MKDSVITSIMSRRVLLTVCLFLLVAQFIVFSAIHAYNSIHAFDIPDVPSSTTEHHRDSSIQQQQQPKKSSSLQQQPQDDDKTTGGKLQNQQDIIHQQHQENNNSNNNNNNNNKNKTQAELVRDILTFSFQRLPEPKNETTDFRFSFLTNLIQDGPFDQEDLALVTHLSVNKINNLDILLRWWNGSAAVAVYINSLEGIETFSNFVATNDLKNVTVHVMLEKTKLRYPHNHLRNLVMENLECDYFFATDADFIPTPNAHDGILELIHHPNIKLAKRLKRKQLFVLPAFEVRYGLTADGNHTNPTERDLPRTKEEVINLTRASRMEQFHIKTGRMGHRQTNYNHWLNEEEPNPHYTINFKPMYEPYVIGYTPGIPRYWEGFRGFGYNKQTWFIELDRAGYQFNVLRDFWVAHMKHPIAKDPGDTKQNRPHYRAFKKYLAFIYTKYDRIHNPEGAKK